MTDVVEIAKERRVRLAAEIAKLGDFILMAEALVKYSQSKSSKSPSGDAFQFLSAPTPNQPNHPDLSRNLPRELNT